MHINPIMKSYCFRVFAAFCDLLHAGFQRMLGWRTSRWQGLRMRTVQNTLPTWAFGLYSHREEWPTWLDRCARHRQAITDCSASRGKCMLCWKRGSGRLSNLIQELLRTSWPALHPRSGSGGVVGLLCISESDRSQRLVASARAVPRHRVSLWCSWSASRLRWFCWPHQSTSAKCEAVGMSTPKWAMGLCQKMLDCCLLVGSELLPRVAQGCVHEWG